MSGSVMVSMLAAVCVLQTISASAIHRSSENNWFRRNAGELRRDEPQQRQIEQHAITRDTTVDALLYTLEHSTDVRGVATIDQELFVLLYQSDTILVYDTSRPSHPLVRNIRVPGLQNGWDLAACGIQQALYLSDMDTNTLYRVGREGQVTSWKLRHQTYGLSVDPATCSVIAVYGSWQRIEEFSDTGRPGSLVSISGQEMLFPTDAVRLSEDRFLVGGFGRYVHEGRVVVVDGYGDVLQSDSGFTEVGSQPLKLAYSMAVSQAGFIVVADRDNHRVVLLDQSLRYIRDLVSLPSDELDEDGKPWRVWLDEARARLYVVDGNTVSAYSLL